MLAIGSWLFLGETKTTDFATEPVATQEVFSVATNGGAVTKKDEGDLVETEPVEQVAPDVSVEADTKNSVTSKIQLDELVIYYQEPKRFAKGCEEMIAEPAQTNLPIVADSYYELYEKVLDRIMGDMGSNFMDESYRATYLNKVTEVEMFYDDLSGNLSLQVFSDTEFESICDLEAAQMQITETMKNLPGINDVILTFYHAS